MRKIGKISLMGFLLALISPIIASAHEAYVLPKKVFDAGLAQPINLSVFRAVYSPENLKITVLVVSATLVGIIIWFFLQHSKIGQKVNEKLAQYNHWSLLIVRLSIAAAFLGSAYTNSFLGPELSLNSLPYGSLIRILFYLASVMILFGLFSRLVGLITFIIFLIAFKVFGVYLLTYFNYLGEILTLLLFGTFFLALDGRIVPKTKVWLEKIRPYESTILRVFYGIALSYAAINIKLLHPILTIDVANIYHLNRFSWLFPNDPILITFGAGLAELAIGAFIIVGFQTRLVVLVSLFYITLSLLFFREAVWPHIMLYGLGFSLLINNGGPLSMDKLFENFINRSNGLKRIFKRL